MSYPRILIAAPNSGSGKTTVTIGLLSALKQKGLKPCSFKCGPDYIDPMFHRNVVEIPSGNLDTFFTEDQVTLDIFKREFSGDIAVIEGVMGLYDGVGGVQETGSTYDLARVLQAPIVLVVDARGAGRSVLAQLKGFLDYDKYGLIKGVILNKTSKSFAKILAPLIESELGIKFIGSVANNPDMEISSRHLGLTLPEEISDLREKIKESAALVTEGIDMDAFIDLAYSSANIKDNISMANEGANIQTDIDNYINKNKGTSKIRIAIARDLAFCFYYRENLELLEALGAKLIPFSPINDSSLPENINGLILGGGYPENYLKELSNNKAMLSAIKNAYDSGIPTMAECGGFMYLLDSITDEAGQSFSMVGAIKGTSSWQGKLVRFGYVTVDDEKLFVKGHEFHYYDTTNNGEDMTAKKPSGTRSWKCIHKNGASIVGYPHLYYMSCPQIAINFVEAARKENGL
ncbi:MAG: cobyrinate a,c-diamide synthase [Pseudobutyrivibrio sp.]|nr:cobyrinate a,c-diamide synthase [Pseudobutyrivibrio sp.]